MTAAPSRTQPVSALVHQWRQDAKRFRSAQEDCDIGDEEWFLCKTEADRLERCADELSALSRPQCWPEGSEDDQFPQENADG